MRFFKGEPEMGGWYTDSERKVIDQILDETEDYNIGFSAKEERIKFENDFSNFINCKHSISVSSGAAALDIAMMCLDFNPGDEVISCAINFPGTHLAIIGQGAKLVLCEPNERTLNIDIQDLERKISKKTRAILVTHMNGLSADVDAILDLCNVYKAHHGQDIKVVIDAARACGGKDNDSYVGAKGWLTTFSFQRKKLMTTLGEGGMISTNDTLLAKRIKRIRAFGMGEAWGTNYNISKIQAAVGRVQLKRLEEMNNRRIHHAKFRNRFLKNLLPSDSLPLGYKNYRHVYYLYTIILPTFLEKYRDKIMNTLDGEYSIGTVIANLPTYHYNKLIKSYTKDQHVPISESIGNRIICPSLHPLMTDEENLYISESISNVISRFS